MLCGMPRIIWETMICGDCIFDREAVARVQSKALTGAFRHIGHELVIPVSGLVQRGSIAGNTSTNDHDWNQ